MSQDGHGADGSPSDLGLRVRRMREALGKSQRALGLACGLGNSGISELEAGKRQAVRHLVLPRLAAELQVPVTYLHARHPRDWFGDFYEMQSDEEKRRLSAGDVWDRLLWIQRHLEEKEGPEYSVARLAEHLNMDERTLKNQLNGRDLASPVLLDFLHRTTGLPTTWIATGYRNTVSPSSIHAYEQPVQLAIAERITPQELMQVIIRYVQNKKRRPE